MTTTHDLREAQNVFGKLKYFQIKIHDPVQKVHKSNIIRRSPPPDNADHVSDEDPESTETASYYLCGGKVEPAGY